MAARRLRQVRMRCCQPCGLWLDGVAGSVYVVEMGEGDWAEFGVGFDGPGALGEGMGLHDRLQRQVRPAPHFQMGWAGTWQGWKTGIFGNRRARTHPRQGPPIGTCKGVRT